MTDLRPIRCSSCRTAYSSARRSPTEKAAPGSGAIVRGGRVEGLQGSVFEGELLVVVRRPHWLSDGIVCDRCVERFLAEDRVCRIVKVADRGITSRGMSSSTTPEDPPAAAGDGINHCENRADEGSVETVLDAAYREIANFCHEQRMRRAHGMKVEKLLFSPRSGNAQRSALGVAKALHLSLPAAERIFLKLAVDGRVAVERRGVTIHGLGIDGVLFGEPLLMPQHHYRPHLRS